MQARRPLTHRRAKSCRRLPRCCIPLQSCAAEITQVSLARPQAADKSPKPGAAATNGKNPLLGTLRRFVSPVSTACALHAACRGCVRCGCTDCRAAEPAAAALPGVVLVRRLCPARPFCCALLLSTRARCTAPVSCRCCWRPSPSLSLRSGATAARSQPLVRAWLRVLWFIACLAGVRVGRGCAPAAASSLLAELFDCWLLAPRCLQESCCKPRCGSAPWH